MIRTYLIPLLAICGVIFAIYTVVQGSKPPVAQPPVIEPPRAPYEAFVAGSGIIESSTQNIAVGSPVGAIVESVGVTVGDSVEAGTTLFTLDTRELNAELTVRKSDLLVAQQQLAKLKAGTRPEQIPPAQARVRELESALAEAEDQLRRADAVSDSRVLTEDEHARRRFAVQSARARLEGARADLALLQAGTWNVDITVAEADVNRANAALAATLVELDRRVIKAPITGKVLQVNVRKGEFANAGTSAQAPIVIGTVNPLHIRVDIDEHEAWRVKGGSRATAFVRGNRDINTTLTFVRFEPYIIPKRSLTGESTERVDTRVLQVLYSFDPKNMPIFVGQQVDVYIESQPLSAASNPVSATPKTAP